MDLGSLEFWEQLAKNPTTLAATVCTIDVVNLNETLQRHPALRAWVNAAHEAARIAEARAEWEVTKARARALLVLRNLTDANGSKKTVQVLEAEVEDHEQVQGATQRWLDAQEKRGALRAMADALEDRKDMLIQIAAKQRQEQREYQS